MGVVAGIFSACGAVVGTGVPGCSAAAVWLVCLINTLANDYVSHTRTLRLQRNIASCYSFCHHWSQFVDYILKDSAECFKKGSH